MEIWGTICKSNPSVYYIIQKVLKSELRKRDGTHLENTILEDWKNKGYIQCTYTSNGEFIRYDKREKINGANVWCLVFKGPEPGEINKESK